MCVYFCYDTPQDLSQVLGDGAIFKMPWRGESLSSTLDSNRGKRSIFMNLKIERVQQQETEEGRCRPRQFFMWMFFCRVSFTVLR